MTNLNFILPALGPGRPYPPTFWRLVLLLAAVAFLASVQPGRAQDVSRYTFAASSGTFTPVVGGTVPHDMYVPAQTLSKNDGISSAITLPFPFMYGGVARTTLQATTDGYIDFSGAGTYSQSDNANATAVGMSLIAPFFDDLNGVSGTASYAVTGTAPSRVFTFEWLNWGVYSGDAATATPSLSFQVKLYETTNIIQFVYRPEGSAPTPAPSARIGIEGNSAAVGGRGNFVSLTDASAAPVLVDNTTSTAEFNAIATRPAAGQVYTFTPGTNLAARTALGTGSLEVFPNPAQRAFTLRLPALAAERTAQVTLFNSLGQQVQARLLELVPAGTQTQIDISTLSSGLYTLRVQAGSHTAAQQVAVE